MLHPAAPERCPAARSRDCRPPRMSDCLARFDISIRERGQRVQAGQPIAHRTEELTTYEPANGGSVWAISEQTLMFISAGHMLRISLNSGTTGVGSYGCTISGYLTIS